MKKLLISAIVLSLIDLSGSQVFAANNAGDSCKVAGKVVTTSVQQLVCAKVAKSLKWVALTSPATTIAPTTTVAATTTTIPLSKMKPVVTLKRSYGTATRSSVSYTVTANKPIDCLSLSRTLGEDFTGIRISRIDSIGQPEPHLCVIEVQAIALTDGDTREIILAAASTFSILDRDGNIQTTLLGSPQSIWVTRPAL